MDYRDSHKDRGETYDEYLANEPISAYMTKIESKLLPEIILSLFPNSLPSYLDFACGTGRITSIVAPMAEQSFSVDISASMLEKFQNKCPNTKFFEIDLTKHKLDIEPVDLITSFRFFGNAENQLRLEVLAALNQLLKKDGYLIINNHRNPWSLQSILSRFTGGDIEFDLSPPKLRNVLEKNGFQIVKTYAIGTWLFRSALFDTKYLNASYAPFLELLSKLPGSYFISPDALIVAKKYK